MEKIESKIFPFVAALWSGMAFADRYGVYEGSGYGEGDAGRSGGNPLAALIALALSVLAYGYLFSSYQDWKNRKVNKENPPKLDGAAQWTISLVGYLVVAVFISFPILLVVKWVSSAAVVRGCWYLIYVPAFILLTYFRRT